MALTHTAKWDREKLEVIDWTEPLQASVSNAPLCQKEFLQVKFEHWGFQVQLIPDYVSFLYVGIFFWNLKSVIFPPCVSSSERYSYFSKIITFYLTNGLKETYSKKMAAQFWVLTASAVNAALVTDVSNMPQTQGMFQPPNKSAGRFAPPCWRDCRRPNHWWREGALRKVALWMGESRMEGRTGPELGWKQWRPDLISCVVHESPTWGFLSPHLQFSMRRLK